MYWSWYIDPLVNVKDADGGEFPATTCLLSLLNANLYSSTHMGTGGMSSSVMVNSQSASSLAQFGVTLHITLP